MAPPVSIHSFFFISIPPFNYCFTIILNIRYQKNYCLSIIYSIKKSRGCPDSFPAYSPGGRLSPGLWPSSKILPDKVHVLHLKGPAIQVLQRSGIGGEVEGELIGVQGLPMAAILSILPLTAVLAVPDEGVSGMGELGL